MRNRRDQLLALLDRSGSQLHALLTRLTLREDVAEDLMQELFAKLARSDGFSRADNPAGYAYRAAMRLAFDWRRAQTRRSPHVGLPIDLPGSHDSPLDALVGKEELEQVLDAANGLNPLRRDVFVMRFIQQESYVTIARQLGKTANQVRGLCHKALRQVREKVVRNTTAGSRKEGARVER